MNTTIHERSQVGRELEITIDEVELQQAFDEAYKTMRPRLALPGFRPGKAPMSIVKKLHGDSIEGDAIEKLAQEKFREAAEEHKIEPIGTPVVTDIHRHSGNGAHFKVRYEIRPEIVLKDFNGMEVEKHIIPVREEDIDRMIDRMLFRRASHEQASVVDDDNTTVRLDFREMNTPEGREPGHSEEEVYLADPDILPELRQALIGHKIGDIVNVELPTTRNRTDQEPGTEKKEAAEVLILDVQKVVLPELSEELIKELSNNKATTREELRNVVRDELLEARAKIADEDLEERIVAKLLDMHDFEVPHTISHAIIAQMLEETQQENTRRGFPPNYGIDGNEFYERNNKIAEMRAKWMLLRDKLIESENIEASDEDLDKLAEEEATKYGLPKENLLKYYHKHDSVKNRIINDKLGALLREKVKVVEKTM